MKLLLSQSPISPSHLTFGLLWLLPVLVNAFPFPSIRQLSASQAATSVKGGRDLDVTDFLLLGATSKRQQPGEALLCNFQNRCGSIRPPYGRRLCVDFRPEPVLGAASGDINSGSDELPNESETGNDHGLEANATEGSGNSSAGNGNDIDDETNSVQELVESSSPSENGRYGFLERQTKNMTMSYIACVVYESEGCSGESLGADYSLSWTPKIIDFEDWNGNNVSARISSIDCIFL